MYIFAILLAAFIDVTNAFVHEINEVCFDKNMWASHKGFDLDIDISDGKSSALSNSKSSSNLVTSEPLVQSMVLALWSVHIQKVTGLSSIISYEIPESGLLEQNMILFIGNTFSSAGGKFISNLCLSIPQNLNCVFRCKFCRIDLQSQYDEPEVLDSYELPVSISNEFKEQLSSFPLILNLAQNWALRVEKEKMLQ
jgi:hypothetical protein